MIKINIKTIYKVCNQIFPFNKALEFDNSGIILNNSGPINRVFVALDLNSFVLEKVLLAKANLIITHHPFIFDLLENELKKKWKSKIWHSLKKNNIAVIAMHTNCDAAANGLNKALMDQLFIKKTSFFNKDNIGLIGHLDKAVELKKFINFIKEKWNLDTVRFSGNLKQKIKKIALVGGSGGEYFLNAHKENVDLFISSEIKWHQFIYSQEIDLNILEVSHDIEKVFIHVVKKELEKHKIEVFFDLEVTEVNYF